MITKKDIMDAYVFLRTKNNTIPDEVLNFIKDAALEKLEPVEKDYQTGIKDGILIMVKNLEIKPMEIQKILE